MNKKEKIAFIQKTLDELFPSPVPSLVFTDNYTLLISVLLSAHTTDRAVNKATNELFVVANTPEQMVQLEVEEIKKLIRACGLAPKKAAYIWCLSKILIDEHKGKVPSTFEELEALPGVGHKTASVVLSQGFGKPAFPVDTHIHRLAKRWGLSRGKSVKETEKDLKKIFPKNRWNVIHLQIIYFGRNFCPARGHEIQKCPICSELN